MGASISPMGVDRLKNMILERPVNIPEGMTAYELQNFLNGYATCQNDVIDIIEDLYDTQKG